MPQEIGASLDPADEGLVRVVNCRGRGRVSEESVIGKPWTDFYVDPEERLQAIEHYQKEGFVDDQEMQLKRADGSTFWALLSILPFEYEDEPARLAWYYDITERKRAEEELAEKEAQLRVALDYMPGGIRFADEDRNYVFFNSRYLELYEFPKGLFKVGKHCRIENLYQAKRGDFGPGDPEALTDDWLAASERGKAVSYEREIVGGGRTLQVYAAPTPEGGYVNIVTDITERKRAEEELAAANAIIKDQKERMESELNVGHEIQMSFVPDFSSLPDRTEF